MDASHVYICVLTSLRWLLQKSARVERAAPVGRGGGVGLPDFSRYLRDNAFLHIPQAVRVEITRYLWYSAGLTTLTRHRRPSSGRRVADALRYRYALPFPEPLVTIDNGAQTVQL